MSLYKLATCRGMHNTDGMTKVLRLGAPVAMFADYGDAVAWVAAKDSAAQAVVARHPNARKPKTSRSE